MSENNTSQLPANWTRTTIGVVVEEKVPQSGPTSGDTLAYVDIGSIDNSSKRVADHKSLPRKEAPSRAKQILASDDVLVSMTRPNLNAVAKVPAELDQAIGSTGFDVLRVSCLSRNWKNAPVGLV
jgi:type I restriction enzyme S subunit